MPAPRPAVLWAVGLLEPLIGLERRQSIETEFHQWCRRHPERAVLWFAGTTSDLAETLPGDDPWRKLSARIGTGVSAITRGPEPPSSTGAANGKPFGTWRDATDLIEPTFDDPNLDVCLAALAEPLSPAAAALLAFAFDGWSAASDAAWAIYRASAVPDEAQQADAPRPAFGELRSIDLTTSPATYPGADALVAAGQAALRWLVHRRATYTGSDDPYVIESAWHWAFRADDVKPASKWEPTLDDLDRLEDRITEHALSTRYPDLPGLPDLNS